MAGIMVQLILFEVLFVGLLGMYGQSIGLIDVNTTIMQITGDWPTIGTAKCSFSAQGPTGSCNVLDTLTLGGIWLISSIGSLLFRLGAALYLIYQLVNVLNLVSKIPFVGPIFLGFQVILGLYGFTMIRGNRPPQ